MPTRSAQLIDLEETDGRRARGARTRLRVLEALLAMADEGDVHATAQQVAARAGVALRTVYHHFEDVEQLRRAALELQLERTSALLRAVEPTDDLAARISIVAHQLRRWFEAVAPVRRAALLDEHSSPATALDLHRYRLLRRSHLADAFASEIEQDRANGRILLDALDAVTTWESWEYLRSALGRSAGASEKTLVRVLQGLLSKPSS